VLAFDLKSKRILLGNVLKYFAVTQMVCERAGVAAEGGHAMKIRNTP
jgi:hypothetical protein